MDATQTLNSSFSNMKHLTNWDRILLRALSRLQGGRVRLTLPEGDMVELGRGDAEVADLRFEREGLSKQFILGGAMAFAEAYIDGAWSTTDLSALLRVLGRSQRDMGPLARGTSRMLQKMDRMMHRLRQNSKENAVRNIQDHYDLSNDMYATFLDPTLTYSAALFAEASDTLEKAQYRKLDRLIDQLGLTADDHVLEIGSGWGACAIRMARISGCRVTSLTLSEVQAKEARRRVEQAGLSERVEIRLQDYRDTEGLFDHVISVEMIEAVGHEYLPDYFRTLQARCKQGGRVVLQAITIPDERYAHYNQSVDFIRKHIFPGGHLPCPALLKQLCKEHTTFKPVNEIEFGSDYAETLRRWRYNFFARLADVRNLGFDDAFIRKWHYYLAYCEAGFDTGMIHVRQYTFQKA